MSAKSPTLTPELYVKEHGAFCPVCESNDISGGSFEAAVGTSYQPCLCLACGSTWNDNYTLTGYSELENNQ